MEKFHDVFISYGRPDSKEFAAKLTDCLAAADLSVWFDFNNIPLGVDYQRQIDQDIESADNFLFIISPHAVNSPYCQLEIERAIHYKKRIIPLLHVESIDQKTWQQRHPDSPESDWIFFKEAGQHSAFANMHPVIRKINWVYCREGIDDFNSAFKGLLELVHRHQIYVHRHTTLLVKALTWERHQKQADYLLIGEERQQAQTWLQERFEQEQPPCQPTDLHCEYITESIKNADNLMTQAFISYAEADRPWMEAIQQFLRRSGITVWTNKVDIQTGDEFLKAIERGIEASDNLIYLLSPNALQSTYCQYELEYAVGLHKRVIPIKLEQLEEQGLPSVLRELQHIDLSHYAELNYELLASTNFLKILRQDTVYHREHKQLLVKALKWQRQNHNPSILLRGYNLRKAEAWLKVAQRREQQPPVPLQIEYINESLNRPDEAFLEVFISYSRTDSDFARRLNDALQVQGKTTWFDQESIASGADFKQEIYRGIESSDNFLFVISPSSIDSPYCADEVQFAARLNKRIITVLHRSVPAAELPLELRQLQWIDFRRRRSDFHASFSELIRTLDIDREHVRSHTKWSQRAKEWEQKERDPDLLLRGSEFAIANLWLQQAEHKQPLPTRLQQAFIETSQASIAAEERREKRQKAMLRSLLGLMSLAFLGATGAGIWAYRLWQQSEINQIQALAEASNGLFLAEQKPEALAVALEAGQKLTSLPRAQPAPVLSALQQAVYGIREQQQLSGHRDQVNSVAFSSEGQLLATASNDNTIKLWDRNGSEIRTLEGHENRVTKIVFSPDSQLLASASDDGTARLWQTHSGKLLHTFENGAQVNSVSFAPSGELLATAGQDGSVRIWDLTGASLQVFQAASTGVSDVTFGMDNQTLATAGDNTVTLWNRSDGSRRIFPAHEARVNRIVFSPDGSSLATASDDQTARVWNLQGQVLQTLSGHDAPIKDIGYDPNGQAIATASDDHVAKLWSLDGQHLQTLSGHESGVWGIAFAPDGQVLATASADNTVKLWQRSSDALTILRGHQDWVVGVDFSPDGQTLATASADKTVKLWSRDGQELMTLRGHTATVNAVIFSPDGQTLATASDDGTARLWNRDGQELVTFSGHDDWVSSVAFSPDGQTLATTSADSKVKLWDRSGREITTFQGHNSWVRSVAFSPDGQTLASACADSEVKIWDRSGQEIYTLNGHQNWVRRVDFSPDGKLLATASADNTARIWNVQSGQEIKSLSDHDYWVIDAVFNPSGNLLATASADSTIKLWDRTGTPLQTLFGHRDWVVSLAFSPDGQTLATTSGDQTIILWNLEDFTLDTLMSRGCEWVQDYWQVDLKPEIAKAQQICQGYAAANGG